MMMVSRRLQAAADAGDAANELIEQARRALYRGQCNCSYWHGAFGGIYLPHLRNAVYHAPDRRRQPARPRAAQARTPGSS